MNVIWMEPARRDARQIFNFYRRKKAFKHIQRLKTRFAETTRLLEGSPYGGKKVPEHNVEEFRQILCEEYWILYYIDEEKIEIHNVIHSSRDF